MLLQMYCIGLYVRIGMELFITSLATNDASHPQGDIAVVGAIVGVVQSFMPYLKTILAGIVEDANASKGVSIDVSKSSLSSTTRTVAVKPLSVLDSQVLWTMAKGFGLHQFRALSIHLILLVYANVKVSKR